MVGEHKDPGPAKAETLPVSQKDLMGDVLDKIKIENKRYRKFQEIEARDAKQGEVITSITSDGKETTNTAKEGDKVVRNQTEAQEEYIVSGGTFDARYQEIGSIDVIWKRYKPLGEVLAIEITRELTQQLNVDSTFYIIPPWPGEQVAKEGDLFVSPLPALDKVYRIARKEFEETYELVKGS